MMESYGRFWAAFNRLPHTDRESEKAVLVSSFTKGRTESLREMTASEYAQLCESLESVSGWKDELRKQRSACLKLMQKAGVDTTDWLRVNEFCLNPRIAGKVFAHLGLKDLDCLERKLRAIIGKGGLRTKDEKTKDEDLRRPSLHLLRREDEKRRTKDEDEGRGWVPMGIVGLMGEC